MSRIQQDQFVDDEEDECCPLCVEEFDLSDRNFRPCPCGYQICQFCYNNIKTTMNGLCPACRRKYDDSTIEFKNITAEELAKYKQQAAQKAKKNAAARQKEAQKAEADTLSRKHLAGLRVVQKNLVYVTGLTPTIREDRLLETLRGNDYFGQYGKIIKIVVSKAKENAQHQQSVGVYVTFARKEDAEACIRAVDGSQNGDRTLRAQYGTTKYCSAYLRGEQCNNRNCMFLHEPGEENDSFTRQDLSLMNVISTQQPTQSNTPQSSAHSPQPQPPPQQRGPPLAAATMNRQDSNEGPSSPAQGDAPALPASANWGSKVNQERRASRSTNASNPSPMTTNAIPAPAPAPAPAAKPSKADEPSKKKSKAKEKATSAETSKPATPQPVAARPRQPRVPGFDDILKTISDENFKFAFATQAFSAEELEAIINFPLLLDPNGGAKRRAMKEKEEELKLQREAERQAPENQATPAPEPEESTETTAGGSLQLGGEPEERHQPNLGHGNQHAIGAPGQQGLGGGMFGQSASLNEDFGNLGLNGRALNPQQQQQLMLLKSAAPQSAGLLSNFQTGQSQQQNLGQAGNASGHGRHASRFSFANDSSSASASVQPVANQKLMSQQSSMMPKNTSHFNQLSQHVPSGGQFYTSGVQGPPPGLKATGTPPVSGGGMFGQGHGFATGGLSYGANAAGRNNSDAMYQDLLRRGMDGGARVPDAGKRESMFPSFLNQHPTTSTPAPAPGLISFPYGPSPGAYQETGSQKSKKKGKKHRHANTSSSGGGGLADVQPDPSILQARLHQGGGMVNQGLYGGQGQGEQVFNSEEEASFNVDALVNDSDFEGSFGSVSGSNHFLVQSRRATPTIPPGFSVPATPKMIPEHVARPISRVASPSITPALPVIPATPRRPVTPVKSAKEKQAAATEPPSAVLSATIRGMPNKAESKSKSRKGSPAKAQSKAEVQSSKETTENATKQEIPTAVAPVVEEKAPAKATQKSKAAGKKSQPAVAAETSTESPVPSPSMTSSKRQHPGKLDIAAATKLIENDSPTAASSTNADSQLKNPRAVSLASAGSVPASPAAISTGSPIKRSTAPRTLRVLPTPKFEVPPPLSAASTAALAHVPTVDKLRSRQASIASLNPPGTPVSELVSDIASVTSTSVSRANSPPPIGGKVGTAPVRKKTKSQVKKERQERARQIAEEEAIADEQTKSDPEPVQAPIVGRKKKAKKPGATTAKPTPVPVKSQPASPKPVTVEEDEEEKIEVKTAPAAPSKAQSGKPVMSSPRRSEASPAPELADVPESSQEKAHSNAQSLLADLQKSGEIVASTLEFFKPLASSLAHARIAQSGPTAAPPDLKIQFSEADLDALAKKKPVRLGGQDGSPGSRTLITPQGKFLRGLTKDLEEKALELERLIEETKGSARFRPRRQVPQSHSRDPHNSSKDVLPAIATALKEAGAKLSKNAQSPSQQAIPKLDPTSTLLGSPSLPLPPVQAPAEAFDLSKSLTKPLDLANLPPPPPAQPSSQPQTPDNALTYLNQFVLPKTDNPAPSSTRSEMAAVGGPPGVGSGNMSGLNVNKIAKAAKVVAEGGTLGGEFEGMGGVAAELLNGVVVQGLEALVGAGLGLHGQDLGQNVQSNLISGSGSLDVQSLMNALESGGALGGTGGGRRGRRSVLSVDEAEQAMLASRKDAEALEKKLAGVMKRNRKFLSGTVGGRS